MMQRNVGRIGDEDTWVEKKIREGERGKVNGKLNYVDVVSLMQYCVAFNAYKRTLNVNNDISNVQCSLCVSIVSKMVHRNNVSIPEWNLQNEM